MRNTIDRNSDRNDALTAALMEFAEWERQAFLLRRFDNASSSTIAYELGRTMNEVDGAIVRVFERVIEASKHA